MQSKEKNSKTICTKNKEAEIPLPADKVAEIAGVSTSTVKKVRTGKRGTDNNAGGKVEAVEELWAEGSNLLIQRIKEIVKL
jgi:predicted transcriptional regulator